MKEQKGTGDTRKYVARNTSHGDSAKDEGFALEIEDSQF